jgi:hypothetical protein
VETTEDQKPNRPHVWDCFSGFEIDELSLVGAAMYFAGPGINHIHCADKNPGTGEDFIGFGFISRERFMDICHVFHLVADREFVSMLCRLFGSFSAVSCQELPNSSVGPYLNFLVSRQIAPSIP